MNTVFFKKLKSLNFNGFQGVVWCIGMQEWIKNILKKIGIAGYKEKKESKSVKNE